VNSSWRNPTHQTHFISIYITHTVTNLRENEEEVTPSTQKQENGMTSRHSEGKRARSKYNVKLDIGYEEKWLRI